MKAHKKNYNWYQQLKKPPFAPPSWLFGVVWTFLYIIIAVSFGFVFVQIVRGVLPSLLAVPFILNLFCNAVYTPIQFRLKNNPLALLDAVLVVATLIWGLVSVFPYYHWVSYVNIPYLLWGTFAAVLQSCITWLNRKR